MARSLLTHLCLFFTGLLLAQPANDDCADATGLPDVLKYCSGNAAFTTEGATTSFGPTEYAVCMEEVEQIKDVWFSFRASRNSATIQVIGNVTGNVRGTLRQPQFSLLGGDCANPEELACRSAFVLNGQVLNSGSLIYNGLIRGETYYIMVGARNGLAGSFELCVEQFDAVPEPSSDCVTGVILCDKSPFSVEALQGPGAVNDELLTTPEICGGGSRTDFNSAWYKWTCDQAGTLSFDITPLGADPKEDIDFVLYEMTGGLNECDSRRQLRQMFSGETDGAGEANKPCFGATGLRDSARDVVENCGCQAGDDNYINSVIMEAGKSYALVVMNFSPSGDGFAIKFGGSGTFLGPDANLVFNKGEACVGEAVTFEDQSTSVDGIASWEWDFGPSATPRSATGAGPHSVTFAEAGNPNVTLAITTTRKCIEYITASEFNVVCCGDQFTSSGKAFPVTCPGSTDGRIDYSGSSNVSGASLSYAWSSGESTANIDDLAPGGYSVTLTDGSGCELVDSFTVFSPAPFTFDTLITQPDCGGATNGALQFTITSGGAGNYTYSFNGSPFQSSDLIDRLGVETVNVITRDGNGCEVEQNIFVDERQLGLVAGSTGFIEPTCFGGEDGQLDIQIANGVAAYRYDFGGGYQQRSRQIGLSAGDYEVIAIDATGCTGEFAIKITEPPLLSLSLAGDSSSCFQANDGSIFSTTGGGRPGYEHRWLDGPTGPDRFDLSEGTYTVEVIDSVGCTITETIILNDPEEITASIVAQENLICFGDPRGSFTMAVSGGSPDYTYSTDGVNFQSEPRLDGLLAGDYMLHVRDISGCGDSLTARLIEPREFILDVATDIELKLGQDTTLFARSNYTPITYSWGPDSVVCLNVDCSRVGILPLRTGDMFVVGTNDVGCIDTAFVSFLVIEDIPTFIPNAFSPDGDGTNDFFTVFGSPAISTVELLQVYDRWGSLVYESAAPYPANVANLGWDGTLAGKPVNAGVYVFYTQLRYINGRIERYRGDITVVR